LGLLRLRHLAEYLLLRLALLFVDLPPLSVAYWFSCRAADLWYVADFRRRRVARANILRSGIVDDPRSASRIARRSYHHFAKVVVESLRSGRYLEGEQWKEHVRLELHPEVQEVLDDPETGLILVSGHFGNWEIAAQLLSMFKPVAGITRPMSNPLTERLIARRKPRYRFRLEPKHAPDPARFVSILRSGEVLALLSDQYAGPRGVMVDFFGHPASTHPTVAMLHLVARAPMCFAWCRRTGPMKFEIGTTGLIRHERSGDKKRDVREILERLNRELERVIREAPDQYLWAHRRWRGDAKEG